MVGLARHGRAHVQQVSAMVGLVHRIGVVCGEFFMGQVGVEVGLACRVGTALKQCCGESCAL